VNYHLTGACGFTLSQELQVISWDLAQPAPSALEPAMSQIILEAISAILVLWPLDASKHALDNAYIAWNQLFRPVLHSLARAARSAKNNSKCEQVCRSRTTSLFLILAMIDIIY
jgi:hypothetical protein